MALVEAVLTYRPTGVGDDAPATAVARTSNTTVIRLLRDRVLEDARAEVQLWRNVDPGVATMRAAELERLERVLTVIVPDAPPAPLRPVRGGKP